MIGKFTNFKKLNIYILVEFLKTLALITLGLFLLILLIDFLEFSRKIQQHNIPLLPAIKIVLFKVPALLESAFQFIILLSSIFTFTKLSSTNELTVMASSRISMWDILRQQSIFIFIFGIFFVICLSPIFATLNQHSEILQNIYTEKDKRHYVDNENGIWLKQTNKDGGEVIIRSSRVYTKELLFKDCILVFLDKEGVFSKRINSESIQFQDGEWLLSNNYIFSQNKEVEYADKIFIPTKLTEKFLQRKIQNSYENIETIPFWQINRLIKDFNESGLETTRFVVRKHYLILVPFIFVIMILITGIFSSSYNRLTLYTLNIAKTLLAGLTIFIIQSTLIKLANDGILSVLQAIWIPYLLFFSLVIILLIKKIELSNLE